MDIFFSVFVSLFLVELLLSIDNALVTAALADQFEGKDRKRLIILGIVLEVVFRIVVLVLMAIILKNVWIKFLCGIYLMIIAIRHLGHALDREGHLIRNPDSTKFALFQIAVADRVFSINTIFAVASFTTNITTIVVAVMCSMLMVAIFAPVLASPLRRYKGLSEATFSIVGILGIFMCYEAFGGEPVANIVKALVVGGALVFAVIYEHSSAWRKFFTPILDLLQYAIAIPLDFYYLIKKPKSV